MASSEVVSAYDNLTLHIVSGPRSLRYFIPFIATPLILSTPSRYLPLVWVRWLLLPVLLAFQIHTWLSDKSFDVISINHALMMFMLLGWYDVRNDFKRVRRRVASTSPDLSPTSADVILAQKVPDEKGYENSKDFPICRYDLEAYPNAFGLKTIAWVGQLCISLRLTDFHIGRPSHDIHQPSSVQPFSSFFLNILAHATLSYVLLNITSSTVTPYLCKEIESRRFASAASVGLLLHLYSSLALFTSHLPTLITLVFLSPFPRLQTNPNISPLTWPSHFGSFTSIFQVPLSARSSFGLRAFWGTFWHQNMRHLTSTPGITLASVLGLRQESRKRYLTVSLVSFFWSGVVHMGVIPPEPLATDWSAWQLRVRIASFFWLQGIGICVELALQHLWFVSCSGITRDQAVPVSRTQRTSSTHAEDLDGDSKSSKAVVLSWFGNLVWSLFILTWTVGFLACTAWCTIWPVGCELKWWYLPLISSSLVTYFLEVMLKSKLR